MKAARFASCNQRLEYLIRVLTEQFRNRNAVYGVLAVRVFVRLIGDLCCSSTRITFVLSEAILFAPICNLYKYYRLHLCDMQGNIGIEN